MWTLTCISVLLVVVSASLFEEADVHFRSFKVKHGKSYKNPMEEAKRFTIFRDNLKSIEEHNVLFQQGKTTWEKGITKYTDWTDEEYKSMLTLQKPNLLKITRADKLEVSSTLTIPDAIDWREQGQVTEVHDQGACAASWAFAVAGSIEAAYFRKTGNLIPLSEQQLLDCSSEIGNQGCNGGYIHETFPYAEWHGLQSNESYPFNGKDGTCQFNASSVVTKIDSFKHFYENQYQLIQVVGNIGPVAGGLDATEIKDYKSGIYGSDNCDALSINLALLIVGYGSENGTNYWIVKNCFGKNWGEDGYIRVLRQANYYSCGLYRDNTYPIIY